MSEYVAPASLTPRHCPGQVDFCPHAPRPTGVPSTDPPAPAFGLRAGLPKEEPAWPALFDFHRRCQIMSKGVSNPAPTKSACLAARPAAVHDVWGSGRLMRPHCLPPVACGSPVSPSEAWSAREQGGLLPRDPGGAGHRCPPWAGQHRGQEPRASWSQQQEAPPCPSALPPALSPGGCSEGLD